MVYLRRIMVYTGKKEFAMLCSFSVSNFRSIVNLRLDLGFCESRAPAGHRDGPLHIFFQQGKRRVAPCCVIFGANASGKSNFVRALWQLQYLTARDCDGLYQPDVLRKNAGATGFALEFMIGGSHYVYEIAYTCEGIVREKLNAGDCTVYEVVKGLVTEERAGLGNTGGAGDRAALLMRECCEDAGGIWRQRRTLLQALALAGEKEPLAAFQYIQQVFIAFPAAFPDIGLLLDYAERHSPLYGRDGLMEEAARILARFDVDVDALVCRDGRCGGGEQVMMHQTADGGEAPIPLEEESSGTQILASLVMVMLLALEAGAPVVIDEMDRALHPFILNCIFDLYKDKEYNEHGSQLIFTTHTTDILENPHLRVSEAAFITKTREGGTELRRLCDFPGVKNGDNFRELYCSGQLSAIPFPYC